ARGGEPIRHGNRVPHGPGRGAAMAEDDETGYAEQGGPTVLRVVKAPPKPAKSPLRKEISDLARKSPLKLVAKEGFDGLDQPFARLQDDVSCKPVADDDIGHAAVNLPPFDVTDEAEGRRLKQAVRIARQIVAFAFLFTDRQ